MKFFNTKKELADLRNLIDDIHKSEQGRIDMLEAEIFKLKHPTGIIGFDCFSYFYGGNSVYYKYAYDNSIKTAIIKSYHNNPTHFNDTTKKVAIKGKYAYIGLKFERDGVLLESYFIVDMCDGKVVECTNQDILDTIDWSPISE